MDMQGLGDLGTAVKMRSPCPRQHITVAVAINTGHTAVGRVDHYLHVPIVYSVERKRSNRKHQTPPRTSAAPWRVCLSIRRRAKFVLPLVASLTGCLADSEQNLRHPQSRKCITYPVADPGCPDTRPFV